MLKLPQEERPRERLLQEGVDALSLVELLAIVLGSGTKDKSVLVLASELVEHFGGLERLLEASVAELTAIRGIGPVKAIQLKAVFGIALKCRRSSAGARDLICSAEQAYRLAREEIAHIPQEVLLVLLRDVKGGLLHIEQVAMGTLSQVQSHPREIFYPAIRHKAFSFILAHNHPSGDPTPSGADLLWTRSLIEASAILSIRLDDHLIVCSEGFVSLRAQGHFSHLKGRY